MTPELTELRTQRQGLYEKLSTGENALFQDVQSAFQRQGVSDPAAIATGWMLAINWGMRARGESAAAKRESDPAKRKELEEARQRALIEFTQNEIATFSGRPVDATLWSELESLGRRYAAAEKETVGANGAPTPVPRTPRARRANPEADE